MWLHAVEAAAVRGENAGDLHLLQTIESIQAEVDQLIRLPEERADKRNQST